MVIGMAEFLDKVDKTKKKEDKIAALKHNDSLVLRLVLQSVFDPSVKWLLPPGEPPYTPSKIVDVEHIFIRNIKTIYQFIEGFTPPNISKTVREAKFIEFLEAIMPDDAKLLISMKEKKLPYKTITAALVKEAFPDLIPTT